MKKRFTEEQIIGTKVAEHAAHSHAKGGSNGQTMPLRICEVISEMRRFSDQAMFELR